jgi:hypothetical protein
MTMPIQTIAQVLAVIIIAGYLAQEKIREKRKLKLYGLAANPERCNQHAEAINKLSEQMEEVRECMGKIADKVGIVL